MINASTLENISPSRLTISNGTVEALKWLALVLMTCDHINKYIYNGTICGISEAGRLSMPLFAFVFAFNLARPDTLKNGVYQRVLVRLVLVGVIASIPYIALGAVKNGWWPLNIIFTLFISGAVILLIEKSDKLSIVLATLMLALGGALVEFLWPAIFVTLSAWHYCKRPSYASLLVWVVANASLFIINDNFWSLLSMPIIFGAPFLQINFPRWGKMFYVYYPGHLFLIWLIVLESNNT